MTRRELLVAVGSSLVLSRFLRPLRGERKVVLIPRGRYSYETLTRYFDRLIIPDELFFKATLHGLPPYDPNRPLRIDGLVKRPLTLTVADLRREFEGVRIICVNQCAGLGRSLYRPRTHGTPWGRGAVGQSVWTGVRLADVLQKAGVKRSARFLRLEGADLPLAGRKPPFVRSLPIGRAMEPDVLLAYEMNGEPLPLAHGGPLRLVVPSWVGAFWVKWLTHIHVQDHEPDTFFVKGAFRVPKESVPPGTFVRPEETVPITTFPVNAIVASPQEGEQRPRGVQEIVGIAYSGEAPIAKVEVSLDGGRRWSEAELEGERGVGRWQIFRYRFIAGRPGTYRLAVRAIDQKGNMQPKEPPWNPGGYNWNGWHTVTWKVL